MNANAKRLTMASARVSGVLCLLVAAASAAAELMPLTDIARAAEEAVRRQVSTGPAELRILAAPLDPRLRLSRCGTALQAEVQEQRTIASRLLVKVRCDSTPAWQLFVPVTVQSQLDVRITRRALARGTLITAADTSTQSRLLPGIAANYVKSELDLNGYILRRPLGPGVALTIDALEPAPTVRRGDTVTVVAEGTGLVIRSQGIALADARPGERVRVRNSGSLKIIEGLADTEGVVRIGP